MCQVKGVSYEKAQKSTIVSSKKRKGREEEDGLPTAKGLIDTQVKIFFTE